MIFNVYTDGGARGNPGPAAIGVVVKDEAGRVVAQISREIGEATNNVAEYQAVISALEWIKSRPRAEKPMAVNFHLDSSLVVFQLRGEWKIKQAHLLPLAASARRLIKELGCPVEFRLIPREHNSQADALVNRALDSAKIG